mmetsp:Transcript_19536/g.45523  ORF Transcript_19536/g.45523 Transcript_19536/m.45523 type:complete len:401 (-) Transcript_19536:24-1226(-)
MTAPRSPSRFAIPWKESSSSSRWSSRWRFVRRRRRSRLRRSFRRPATAAPAIGAASPGPPGGPGGSSRSGTGRSGGGRGNPFPGRGPAPRRLPSRRPRTACRPWPGAPRTRGFYAPPTPPAGTEPPPRDPPGPRRSRGSRRRARRIGRRTGGGPRGSRRRCESRRTPAPPSRLPASGSETDPGSPSEDRCPRGSSSFLSSRRPPPPPRRRRHRRASPSRNRSIRFPPRRPLRDRRSPGASGTTRPRWSPPKRWCGRPSARPRRGRPPPPPTGTPPRRDRGRCPRGERLPPVRCHRCRRRCCRPPSWRRDPTPTTIATPRRPAAGCGRRRKLPPRPPAGFAATTETTPSAVVFDRSSFVLWARSAAAKRTFSEANTSFPSAGRPALFANARNPSRGNSVER